MSSIIEPSQKQKVRDFLLERQKTPAPPPSRERVRELMGWPLIEAEQGKKSKGIAR